MKISTFSNLVILEYSFEDSGQFCEEIFQWIIYYSEKYYWYTLEMHTNEYHEYQIWVSGYVSMYVGSYVSMFYDTLTFYI